MTPDKLKEIEAAIEVPHYYLPYDTARELVAALKAAEAEAHHQEERAAGYEGWMNVREAERDALAAKLAVARDALEEYRDRDAYIHDADIARAALQKLGEGEGG